MNKSLVAIIIVLSQIVVAPVGATLITDNTGTANTGTHGVGAGSWIAESFTTDNTNYILDAINLADMTTVNSSAPFTLSLYSDNSGVPGSTIAALNGPINPTGLATYTPASVIFLNALTTYFVVAQSSGSGIYGWSHTGSTAQVGPGTIGNDAFLSINSGASWTTLNESARMSVEGTAVPEAPAVLCLGLVSCALIVSRAAKRRPLPN
jgi:hypothetical protein